MYVLRPEVLADKNWTVVVSPILGGWFGASHRRLLFENTWEWKRSRTMPNPTRITALVGSYRKGGVIDRAVEEILAAARESGAETTKIYLIDEPIEFCANCRACTQTDGVEPAHVSSTTGWAPFLTKSSARMRSCSPRR